MEPDWIREATGPQLKDYVAEVIDENLQANFMDFSLWSAFRGEFESFTIRDFGQMSIPTRL